MSMLPFRWGLGSAKPLQNMESDSYLASPHCRLSSSTRQDSDNPNNDEPKEQETLMVSWHVQSRESGDDAFHQHCQ